MSGMTPAMKWLIRQMVNGRPLEADPSNKLYPRLYPKPAYLGDLTPVHLNTVLALCKRKILKAVKSPRLHYRLTAAGRKIAEGLEL